MVMKVCRVCIKNRKGVHTAEVYDENGSTVVLLLCSDHDIELFKKGQQKFISKYQIDLPTHNQEKEYEINIFDDIG
jgi:hypothetical protein